MCLTCSALLKLGALPRWRMSSVIMRSTTCFRCVYVAKRCRRCTTLPCTQQQQRHNTVSEARQGSAVDVCFGGEALQVLNTTAMQE
jgi:hypothetical protein